MFELILVDRVEALVLIPDSHRNPHELLPIANSDIISLSFGDRLVVSLDDPLDQHQFEYSQRDVYGEVEN